MGGTIPPRECNVYLEVKGCCLFNFAAPSCPKTTKITKQAVQWSLPAFHTVFGDVPPLMAPALAMTTTPCNQTAEPCVALAGCQYTCQCACPNMVGLQSHISDLFAHFRNKRCSSTDSYIGIPSAKEAFSSFRLFTDVNCWAKNKHVSARRRRKHSPLLCYKECKHVLSATSHLCCVKSQSSVSCLQIISKPSGCIYICQKRQTSGSSGVGMQKKTR